MRKRMLALNIIILPLIVLIWMIGWALYVIGDKKK
jgi:hypothetical protein